MINRYYQYIVEINNDLKTLTSDEDKYHKIRNEATLFEYISACYNNAYHYSDNILNSYKDSICVEKYDTSPKSAGIDLIDIDNNILYQCKNYKQKKLTPNDLGTFFNTMNRLNSTHHGIISVNEHTTDFNIFFNDKIELQRISDDSYNNILNEAYKIAKEKDCVKDIKPANEKITLLNFQQEVINLIDNNDVYRFKLPCGTGKTFLMAYYINQHPELKIAVITPTIYLANQLCNLINRKCNKIFEGKYNDKYNVSIIVAASLQKISLNKFDIVFVDEAHHEESNIHDEGAWKLKNINCKRKYYFSATLENFDYEYTYEDAIDNNNIVDVNMNIHYYNKQIDEKAVVYVLKEHLEYQHVIVYCNTIESCEKLTKELKKNNINAETVHSNKSLKHNNNILKIFEEGNLRIIVTCNYITEGVNIKCCDTAFFYEERHSKIQVIQCIGRTQRLYKGKLHGNFVLLASNETIKETHKYLQIIYNYDTTLFNANKIRFINDSIQYVDENEDSNNNNDYNNDNDDIEQELFEFKTLIFEQIFKNDIRLQYCKEFYKEFNRLPKSNEVYKGWGIGSFINKLKQGINSKLKPQVEEIFQQPIEVQRKRTNITKEEKIILCKEFYEKFNKLPTRKEVYKGWGIGTFIDGLKQRSNSKLKPQVEEIFQQPIETKRKIINLTDEEKIILCKEFYEEFNKLPTRNEVYKGWNIGNFMSNIKRGNSKLKPQVEEIFQTKF